MRLIKMIGLAAIAALAAMALVGASSASASNTQLCKTDTTPCGSPVTQVHEVSANAELITSILTVHCVGLFLSSSVGPLAAPQIIKGNFTYTSCVDNNGNKCEAIEKNGPVEIKVLKTATELAEVTGKGEVLVECGSFLHCVYNGTGLKGHGLGALLAGGNGATTTTKAVVNKVSGFLCPATSELTVTYTPLSATYISS